MTTPIASLRYFTGINNLNPAVRTDPVLVNVDGMNKMAYPLESADNVHINNSYELVSRDGSDLKVSGTNYHSGWSDPNNPKFTDAFVIDGTTLYLVNKDYTQTALLTLLSPHRMSYTSFNDRVYMTNNSYIGYYGSGSMHSLPATTLTYKSPLPAGKFIAVYRNRLLVARKNVLYIADSLTDHYDTRYGYRQFVNDITMVRVVEKGFYVSDGKTYFVTIGEGFENNPNVLIRKDVFDIDAIPYTDATINGKDVGKGTDSTLAIWMSSQGICIGDDNGNAKVQTLDTYVMTPKSRGTSIIRNSSGQSHYLAVLE
jgi:hypothetical protein